MSERHSLHRYRALYTQVQCDVDICLSLSIQRLHHLTFFTVSSLPMWQLAGSAFKICESKTLSFNKRLCLLPLLSFVLFFLSLFSSYSDSKQVLHILTKQVLHILTKQVLHIHTKQVVHILTKQVVHILTKQVVHILTKQMVHILTKQVVHILTTGLHTTSCLFLNLLT
jgi:hypothetical protein